MMTGWNDFHGLNLAYIVELYERYRRDPESVDPETRSTFDRLTPPQEIAPAAEPAAIRTIVAAVNLADSIRRYGHLAARFDPLGRDRPGDPALSLEAHGLTEEDLRRLPASLVAGPLCDRAENAWEAIEGLRRLYCSTIGYDYAHIFPPDERAWLREAAECGRFRAPNDPNDPRALLERLTQVEAFERFLHRTFPGKTRFSIEGLDMLVPILDDVIAEAAEAGIHKMLIGMAHRGRLNVLAHVLHKPYGQILAEFKDPVEARSFREDMAWTGDVKYHMGAHRAIAGGREVDLTISLPPNPSHLEAIGPVVEGMARAAGTLADHPGRPRFDPALTLPILIHGDAAFPGQGVVAETLNFSRLPGYDTGGTIHIIVNNQLGFTTSPEHAYSTTYASGMARGFKIPIVHVNADDPEACIEVARLAFAYRARFQKDFLIDLIGYRRYGHNEGDEPAFTQPTMYRAIANHPTVRELWAGTLLRRGDVEPGWPDELNRRYLQELQRALEALKPEDDLTDAQLTLAPAGAARKARTGVPVDRLRELNDALLTLPDGFAAHRKLERARDRRRHVLDDPDTAAIDWATAEELALASILADGIPIRMTGQDVERGTFSQRHAVFHDVETGGTFTPLQAMPQARASFEIYNSPLTENAVLGFEYGYNVQAPDRLVIWEAQYGDFINNAQVILDEFLVSARAKWGQTPSLVLLLPHGLEGQGPDHASARPERFLQLAADLNLRLANCTTAAQYFHLLRRQAALLDADPLPLIVLTPKSLLRHPLVASAARELAEARWQEVIDDRMWAEEDAERPAAAVQRVLLCSGKIFLDLITGAGDGVPGHPRDALSPSKGGDREGIAICRVEQLYPFPRTELLGVLRRYPAMQEVVWVQEEPENMGAWEFFQPLLGDLLQELAAVRPGRPPARLRYIARPRSSSPAEGSAARHTVNQRAIVEQALRRVPVEEEVGTRR